MPGVLVLDGGGAVLGLGIIVLWVLASVVGLVFYFVPTIIALMREHQSGCAIGVVNLLFGWSFVGWVVSLVWALTSAQPTVVVQQVGTAQPQGQSSGGRCLACGSWNVALLPDGSRVCGACGQRGR